jgi:hypothetical protein
MSIAALQCIQHLTLSSPNPKYEISPETSPKAFSFDTSTIYSQRTLNLIAVHAVLLDSSYLHIHSHWIDWSTTPQKYHNTTRVSLIISVTIGRLRVITISKYYSSATQQLIQKYDFIADHLQMNLFFSSSSFRTVSLCLPLLQKKIRANRRSLFNSLY